MDANVTPKPLDQLLTANDSSEVPVKVFREGKEVQVAIVPAAK